MLTIFGKKLHTIDFWLGSKYSSWQYCQKKSSHLKVISPVLSKTFCAFILIMHNLFCHKNQKKVLLKEIKDWTFEAYLLTEETSSWFPLTEETSSWFPLTESFKRTCARSYAWFLNFYQTERVWIVFCNITYPNLVK